MWGENMLVGNTHYLCTLSVGKASSIMRSDITLLVHRVNLMLGKLPPSIFAHKDK